MKKGSKRRSSISGILVRKIIITVAVILAVTILAAAFIVKREITVLSENALTQEAQSYNNEISGWVNGKLNLTNAILGTLRSIPFQDDAAILDYLGSTLTLDEDIPYGIYMGDATNRYLDASGFVPDEDYVVAERTWYIDGIDNDTMEFGEPYLDASTGTFMVSASAKVNGTTVAAADIALSTISDMIHEMAVLDTGYAFLVDVPTNMIIAHKVTDYDGQEISGLDNAFLQEVSSYLTQEENQQIYTVWDKGQEYMVKITAVEGTTWALVSCVQTSTVFATVQKISLILAGLSVLMIVFAAILLFWQIRKTTAPIKGLTEDIVTMTNGDFTIDVAPKGNDEITTMSENLQAFVQKMQTVIGELVGISDKLSDQSQESRDLSEGMSESAKQQSDSMRQLKETVDELARSIQDIAENATSLAMTVSDVTANSDEARQQMQNAVSVTNQGREDIEQVTETMNRINDVIEKLDASVKEVGQSTEEINHITDIIGSIAGQTNLLALNASIEAARAGEAGKGFAVVAGEIGNLANMCADAVSKIEQLIRAVSEEVEAVVRETQKTVEDIAESKTLVENTHVTFGSIYESIIAVDSLIEEVAGQIKTVDDVATNMAAITQEQSASTEEILATSENLYEHALHITNDSEGVKEISDDLSVSAENIDEHMKQFII